MDKFDEEVNVVTLYDENGNAEDYEIIDIFEVGDNVYAAVTAYQDSYDENLPIEVTMLKVTEENGEEFFSAIESIEEEEMAYNELLKRDEEYNN